MDKSSLLEKLLAAGVIGIIRVNDREKVRPVLEALCAGGIRAIEITLTIPGAVELIRELRTSVSPDILIGAGTVTDGPTARTVIEAGAQFIVSPIFSADMVAVCNELGIPAIPGCQTATEIYTAWKSGADIVKLFPSKNLGPRYLRDISGPFPQIKIMPTSVDIEMAADWIAAGAVAVGVGAALLDKAAIAEGRYEIITERAKTLVANVAAGRSRA